MINGRLETIWRSEVNDYLDAWFWSAFDVWHRWKLFGCLPFAGGWAEQPAHLVQIIESAEAAYRSGNGSR